MDKLKEYAIKNNIPIMQDDGILFLTKFIKDKKIINVLELGTAIGYSAIKMAQVDKNIKITTIERDIKRYNEAINNIALFSLNNQIKVINDDIFNIKTEEKFDLIFIDAAKAQNINFFEKFKNNLSGNGFIITDNLNFHGLVNNIEEIKSKNLRSLLKKINGYVEFLKNNKEFKTVFYDIGDGISISYR